MQTIFYSEAGPFLERTLAHFLSDEVRHAMPLGIAQSLAKGKAFGDPAPGLWVVEAGGALVAVAIHTPPFPMQLWYANEQALHTLLEECARLRWPLNGLFAETELARRASQRWCQLGPWIASEVRSLRAFRLDHVRPPLRSAPGAMRRAYVDEEAVLCEWVYRFAVDCMLQPQIDKGVPKHIETLHAGDLFLWVVDGKPVSMAALTRESPRGRTLSLVYTPSDFRGLGYASMLVAALSQAVLDGGKEFCTLYTDLANPTSNHIYTQIGYEPVADFVELAFAEAQTKH